MPFCVIDAAAREHAHNEGLQADRDDYIDRQVSEVLTYLPSMKKYLWDWHDGSLQLIQNIEKGLLDDDDYHGIHAEAVEIIRDGIEEETP